MALKTSKSGFSRPYDVAGLGRELVRIEIDPSETERQALQDRLHVLKVGFVHADAELQRQAKTALIELRVAYRANVTQACVATLMPVDQEIEEAFIVTFSDADIVDPLPEGVEIVHTLEDDDPPDAIVDGKIDVAEILAEFMALALDPYPRSANVSEKLDAPEQLDATDAPDKGDEENKTPSTAKTVSDEDRIYPFANLKDMMKKK